MSLWSRALIVICFFAFFFNFWFLAPACSQSLHASQNPLPVGSTVTLSSDSSVSSGAWLFNNDIIVMIFGGNQIISDQWKERVIFNSTSNHTSLAIRSLQVADSGMYTLQALNLFRIQLQLSVQGKTDYITLLCVCSIPLIPLFYEGKSNRAQFTPVIMTTFVLCHGWYAKQKSRAKSSLWKSTSQESSVTLTLAMWNWSAQRYLSTKYVSCLSTYDLKINFSSVHKSSP